jgi:hypothetical protein
MLVRCLYASRPSASPTASIVESIVEQSRRNNPRSGITGLLCCTESVFIQVLEGGRNNVCRLIDAIIRDERHTHVQILLFEEISERKFGNWTMGRVDIGKSNQALVLKYSETTEIDPFACSGHATLALLTELMESGSISGRGNHAKSP